MENGGGWARSKRTTSYKVINTTDTWKKSQKPFTRFLLKKNKYRYAQIKRGWQNYTLIEATFFCQMP